MQHNHPFRKSRVREIAEQVAVQDISIISSVSQLEIKRLLLKFRRKCAKPISESG
jgi:hypothetical protein